MKKRFALLFVPIIAVSCGTQNNDNSEEALLLPDVIVYGMISAKNNYMKTYADRYNPDNDLYDYDFGHSINPASRIDSFEIDNDYINRSFSSRESYEEWKENIYLQEKKLFSEEDGYVHLNHYAYIPRFTAGVYLENEKYHPSFFKLKNKEDTLLTGGGDVDIVKYKDSYAYIHTYFHAYNPEIDSFYCFLYLITQWEEKDIPYNIYFWTSEDQKSYKTFLIPKNDEFKEKCISKIENEPGMQRYNIQQARIIIEKAENS